MGPTSLPEAICLSSQTPCRTLAGIHPSGGVKAPTVQAFAGFPVANIKGLLQNTAVPQLNIDLGAAQKTTLPAPVSAGFDHPVQPPSCCACDLSSC